MPTALEAEILNATAAVLALVEKPGSYYYEDVVYKRWWLGPGGQAGNCEECWENAEAGEIQEDEFFPAWGAFGPVDEPPLHPHCLCSVTYRDSRRRVYV